MKLTKKIGAAFLSVAVAAGIFAGINLKSSARADNSVVILYFTGSGNTRSIAKKIRKSTGGKLLRIEAADPYTRSDLDYSNEKSRVVKEHKSNGGDDKTPLDSKVRPKIKNLSAIKKAVKAGKTIYIGYPIWWQQAPHIMYSLVENVNLSGKKVVPFNSSMASGTGKSSDNLLKDAKVSSSTVWLSGKGFTDKGPSQKSINNWVQNVKKTTKGENITRGKNGSKGKNTTKVKTGTRKNTSKGTSLSACGSERSSGKSEKNKKEGEDSGSNKSAGTSANLSANSSANSSVNSSANLSADSSEGLNDKVTEGKIKDREFTVDNVLHSESRGDIHFSSFIPKSYTGSEKYALFITLPGWEGEYPQGLGENLKEFFPFEAQKYNSKMIIISPQLKGWDEASAEDTIALTEYILRTYNIDRKKVYLEGYSGGGETGSAAVSKRPDLYTVFLIGSSKWDGDYDSVVNAKLPVYLAVGESDSYYGSGPLKKAYNELHERYVKKGLSEKEIGSLLVLDVKPASYFTEKGFKDQHAGGQLFAKDGKIMGWLFNR